MENAIISALSFREEVTFADIAVIRSIVESTGFFYPDEVAIAVELIQDRLARGLDSGYYFLFAQKDDAVIGYSCYGPIAGSRGRFEIYWIAVNAAVRNLGVGSVIMQKTEEAILTLGGLRGYIETSSREKYRPTLLFYRRNGYTLAANLKAYYAEDDDKLVYVKELARK